MMQNRRYFATVLKEGGKLQLIGFYSISERKKYCDIKENHARPITMKKWNTIPKNMKYI